MKRTSRGAARRRTSRGVHRNASPPALYRAIGVGSDGRRVPLGAGPLSRMRDTAMASWMGDPSLRSAYVVDPRGHAYLSLEPKDRARLRANRVDDMHNGQLDTLEHEVEYELNRAWSALQAKDTWRARDSFAHVEALWDFATPSQRAEIASLRSAIKSDDVEPWHDGVARNARRRTSRSRSGFQRRVVRNNSETTAPGLHGALDEEFAQREHEARALMSDDLATLLDEAEDLVKRAEAKASRAWTTHERQEAADLFVRATMHAEVAYHVNCSDNHSEQCYRSGELINRAKDGIYALLMQAHSAGVKEAVAELSPGVDRLVEATKPKKKGWFSW